MACATSGIRSTAALTLTIAVITRQNYRHGHLGAVAHCGLQRLREVRPAPDRGGPTAGASDVLGRGAGRPSDRAQPPAVLERARCRPRVAGPVEPRAMGPGPERR